MITYQLKITNAIERVDDEYWKGFDLPVSVEQRRDAEAAADSIEMQHSDHFTWVDDEQEDLSRRRAINYAEHSIMDYTHSRKWLDWEVTNSVNSSRYGHAKVVLGN